MSGSGFAAPVVVTGSDFRFIVTEQLLAEGIEPGAILIEPEGRNTAPAVLAAALHVAATDPDTLILLAPSDHAIGDDDAFRATVQKGVMAALAGQIVTFGITPTRAETGYGWLEIDGVMAETTTLKRFVEKPDAARAEAMLNEGGFLWNSGIFLVTARTLIAAFEAHAPNQKGIVTVTSTQLQPSASCR
jgi:mannose-1-phosphate guanylyltransferase/mannose-6-phosphate isomerase